MPLRIVFFGSPQFAVPTLQALASDSRLDVALVVTQPDRPFGRGRRINEPPVKIAARRHQIEIWQPDTLRTPDSVDRLRNVQADLFVVVAYGELFRRTVLALPRFGCLNVHPSLLPKYRGSSPIPAAILNGDPETGVSIIQMVRRLDAGPIVAQQKRPLDGTETGGSLSDDLAELAASMMPDVAVEWAKQRVEALVQDEERVSFTHELTKNDGRIDWTADAPAIERKVRAYQPWPTAWTMINGRRLVVVASLVNPQFVEADPGSIHRERRDIVVACGSGSIRLVTVQPEGKGAMPAEAWYRGLQSANDLHFESIT